MEERLKKTKRRIFVLIVILIPLLIVFVYNITNYTNKIEENILQTKELNSQYDELLAEEIKLKKEASKLQNEEYLIKYAREKYLLSKENEIIFKFGDRNE